MSRVQVESIVHLVAGAVPRLHKENVSVVDTTGNILYEHRDRSIPDDSVRTNAQLVYQRRLEDYYKHKISSLLEDALGTGRIVVQVSADIDFDRVETSEDKYDPDTIAIRSEQSLTEKELDRNAAGIPGVKGGLADKLQGNLEEDNGLVTKKNEKTKNYEVSRIKRQTSSAIGKLNRLSVGVLVDGTYMHKDGKTEYVARSPEEMTKLHNIVRAAMGFSEERGDELSIQNVAFSATRKEKATMTEMVDMSIKILKPLANLILALLFIFLVLRPILNRYVLSSREEEAREGEEGGDAVAFLLSSRNKIPRAINPAPPVPKTR